MKPWLDVGGVTVFHGDCIEVMRQLLDNSVDAVVTDPPYGLEFMGKDWDAPWKQAGDVIADPASVGGFQDGAGGNPFSRSRIRYGREDGASVGFQLWFTDVATEALRVLKPGGHLLAFGGTRTWHRLAVAIEDAGFEVRDSVAWMYGSGFPKSLDVSNAIDKRAGAERVRIVEHAGTSGSLSGPRINVIDAGAPATPAAEQWQGWGTALKPAHEPIVVARKPLIGTVAENVLTHGTGALNIDGCRIGTTDNLVPAGGERNFANEVYGKGLGVSSGRSAELGGRWPANVILDESQAAELDKQSGNRPSRGEYTDSLKKPQTPWSIFSTKASGETNRNNSYANEQGGASRFFYVAKASKKERPNVNGIAHPTVKPMALMRYLVRLVTPPGGTVLEPFAGSGTTIEACVIEGFNCIAIEREAEYLPLIEARLNRPIQAAL